MGMYALIEDAREQELAAAVEAANEWQNVGRHIILASLRLMQAVDDDLFDIRHKLNQHSTWKEASDIINDANENLREMLGSIRDDFLCDQRKSWNNSMSDDEAEEADAFNDQLEEAVISVRDLEKIVEREDYEAFLRGKR